tara:strand:+ start:584 stop:1015 length:432 start_codon:yes stop_codon:yes gene_type:complete
LNKLAEEFKDRALKSYESPKVVDCNCLQKEALVVFFEFDRTALNIKTQNYLKGIIQCLKHTKYYIKLNVFENELSPESLKPRSKAYPINLSQRRAKIVRDFLLYQGVWTSQLQIVGYGKHDDGNKLLNLIDVGRVEIIISPEF